MVLPRDGGSESNGGMVPGELRIAAPPFPPRGGEEGGIFNPQSAIRNPQWGGCP